MVKGLFQEFLRISTFGIILSVYYQTASPNRRPCKLCRPDLQPIIDHPSKEHAEAETGKSELVKARLLGNQCVILPQTRIVGCCHNLLHPGKLTKRLMTQHDCLGKNCRHFEKYEDAGYSFLKSLLSVMLVILTNSDLFHYSKVTPKAQCSRPER